MRCENCTAPATRILRLDWKDPMTGWVGHEKKLCASCCVRVAEKAMSEGKITSIGNL